MNPICVKCVQHMKHCPWPTHLVLTLTLSIRHFYYSQWKEEEIKSQGYTKTDETTKLNPSNQPPEPGLHDHHKTSFKMPEIYRQKKKCCVFLSWVFP